MKSTSFVDPGLSKGKDFMRMFLQSPEFHIQTLKRLSGIKSQSSKAAIAWQLAERLQSGLIKSDHVLQAYAYQNRMWLSLKLGAPTSFPKAESPQDLLQEFGESTWYGPLTNPKRDSSFYLRPFAFRHFIDTAAARVRWMIIAEVDQSSVSLSWNGFTTSSAEGAPRIRFPFWNYISTAFSELENIVGGNWEYPSLNKLVLKDLWSSCIDDPDYKWQHLRVRAEASGVKLNASSAGVSDVDVKGLKALTRELARSAIRSVAINLSDEDISRVENALLRTLVQEWGTNSYEFSLEKVTGWLTAEVQKLRGHYYFGLRPGHKTQDSLQHIRCYASGGGSANMRRFIIQQLKRFGA